VVEVHKESCVVEFEGAEISLLFEFLVEGLRVWSEKGFEGREEKEQFQRVVRVVSKLREAIGETTTLFL
jgi:hypothetical protein